MSPPLEDDYRPDAADIHAAARVAIEWDWPEGREAASLAPARGGLELLGQRDQRRARDQLEHLAVAQHDLQVGQRDSRVLAGERLGASTLPALDRLDQPLVVAVGDHEDLSRLRQLGLGQHHRVDAAERQRQDPVERAVEQGAAGDLEHACVKALVEVHVGLERLVVGEGQQRLDLGVDRAQRADLAAGRAALGGEARSRALEHAAQLDRVAHVGLGERAHRVATAREVSQQALVLERGQRQAQRRARHAETLHERQLAHPLARLELAAEDQFAQPQQRPHHLGSAGLIRHLPRLLLTLRAAARVDACMSRLHRRGTLAPPDSCMQKCQEKARQGFFGVKLGMSCIQPTPRLVSRPRFAKPGRVQSWITRGGEIGEVV